MRLDQLVEEISFRVLNQNLPVPHWTVALMKNSGTWDLGINSGSDAPIRCDSRRDPAGRLTGCDGPSPGLDRAKLESFKIYVS